MPKKNKNERFYIYFQRKISDFPKNLAFYWSAKPKIFWARVRFEVGGGSPLKASHLSLPMGFEMFRDIFEEIFPPPPRTPKPRGAVSLRILKLFHPPWPSGNPRRATLSQQMPLEENFDFTRIDDTPFSSGHSSLLVFACSSSCSCCSCCCLLVPLTEMFFRLIYCFIFISGNRF